MKISISSLKSNLQGKTWGRSLTNIPNLYSVIQETLNSMMMNVSLLSAIRKQPLLAPLKEAPYLRLLPNDIATGWFIDAYVRDYTTTFPLTRIWAPMSEFQRRFSEGFVNIEYLEGEQYLNLRDSAYNSVAILDSCDDSTNGLWVPVGTATNIAFDTSYKLTGTASLAFNTPITTGQFGVEKSNFADVAISTDKTYITLNFFTAVYIPTITIRYGTNSLNYHEVSTSVDWNGKRPTTGWNTLAFDLSTKTTTGVVADDNVTYFALLIDQDIAVAPSANFRIDSVYLTDGYTYDLKYYSNSIVEDQWGTRRSNNLIASESDFLLLNEAEMMLFLMQFSEITSIDNRPDSGVTEYQVYSKKLAQAYDNFKLNYPSQKILTSSAY